MYYQTLVGTALFAPFIFLEETLWNEFNSIILLNVVILGVFDTALGYILYVYALRKLGITTTSLYLNLSPIVTLTASVFVIQEVVNCNQIFGIALVILSVFLINY